MSGSPRPRRSLPIRWRNGPRLRRAVASAISAPTVGLGGGADRHGAGRVGAARGLGSPHVGEHVLLRARRASGENGSPRGGASRRDASDGSGTTLPAGAVWNPASCVHPCAFNGQQFFYVDSVGESSTSCYLGNGGGTFTDPAWPGWTRSNRGDLRPYLPETTGRTRTMGRTTSSQQEIGFVPPSSLTLGEYQTYVGGLPAANPNSIESKTAPVGQGATAPAAENVTTLPVSPTEVVPTVKPASQVGPTDAVIDPECPCSSGATTSSALHANDDDDHDHDDQSGWISDSARGIDQLRVLFSGES